LMVDLHLIYPLIIRALHNDSEAVIKTHKDFVDAGADIITTNTYQASGEHLRKHLGDHMM